MGVCEVVPTSRLGEANGLIGSAKSLTSLLAYVLVTVVSQVMMENGWLNSQWIYFPAASSMSLCMIIFAMQFRLQPTSADDLEKPSSADDLEEPSSSHADSDSLS